MEKWPPTAAIPYTRKVAEQGAHEGECREREEEQARRAGRDGDDCADSAARRNADDAGVGHRVAEEALHGGARDAERHAHRCADDDAGQADLLDDELLGAGELAGVEADEGEDDGRDVADGDVDGAEAEGDERAE